MGKDAMMLIFACIMVVVVVVYFIYDKSKNKKSKSTNGKETKDTKSSITGVKRVEKAAEQKDMSGFIKFDKIANDMIYQNNGERYTMVIQCKGINYNLMSEIEQMAVEEGFIMFLNTLKFPIQLYVQTRSVDLSNNIKTYKGRVKQFVDKQNEVITKYNEVEDDVDSTQDEINYMKKEKVKYTNIAEYVSDITRYVERMALNKYMLQRNFYVVFSYNKSELVTTEKFSKEEYEDLCYRELYTRAQGIIGSLVSCSVNCRILNSNELAQLVYVSLNKDDANTMNIKDALESGVFRLYTSSEDVMKKKREMIDEELNAQSKLRIEQAVQEAISKGLIVTEAESEEAVQKEIDRRALKMIDKSTTDENVKQELKNIIKENRKERVKILEQKKSELNNQNVQNGEDVNAKVNEDENVSVSENINTEENINEAELKKELESENIINGENEEEIIGKNTEEG